MFTRRKHIGIDILKDFGFGIVILFSSTGILGSDAEKLMEKKYTCLGIEK